LSGVTDIEDRVAEVTVRVVLPEVIPEVAVTVVVPAATAMARPVLLTVATDGLEALQVTCLVISKLVPSEYTPEAASCWVAPKGIFGLDWVTDMEASAAEVTVRAVAPWVFPEMTRITTEPAVTAVARPLPLTVAITGFDELQITCVVISRLVPSEKMPEAVNCRVTPTGMLGLAGVTAMETSDAGVPLLFPPPQAGRNIPRDPRNNIAKVNLIFFIKKPRFTPTRGHCTVRVVFPETTETLEAALMVAEPVATAVARPLPSTVATNGLDEAQKTCLVRSWLVPSE